MLKNRPVYKNAVPCTLPVTDFCNFTKMLFRITCRVVTIQYMVMFAEGLIRSRLSVVK